MLMAWLEAEAAAEANQLVAVLMTLPLLLSGPPVRAVWPIRHIEVHS